MRGLLYFIGIVALAVGIMLVLGIFSLPNSIRLRLLFGLFLIALGAFLMWVGDKEKNSTTRDSTLPD